MAFDFPASPTEGQQFTPVGGPTYQFTNGKWEILASAPLPAATAQGQIMLRQSAGAGNFEAVPIPSLVSLTPAPTDFLMGAQSAGGAPRKILVSDVAPAVSTFFAHKADSNQTVPNGTITKITFGTVDWNVGGFFSTANSRWTPPAGKVFIGCKLHQQGGTDASEDHNLYLYKNGAQVRYLTSVFSAAGGLNLHIQSGTMDLADGDDYYEIFYIGGGPSNKTISGSKLNTNFWGFTV